LIDDSRFRARFPGIGTSLERAVAETVAAVRSRDLSAAA
jgi:hypothetical protein